GADFRVEGQVRFILGIGGGGVFVAGAEGGFNAAADFTQDNPFLADFVIGEKTTGQQGVAAVIDAQVGGGGTAAAGDEEDQPCAVALSRGVTIALGPHRSAQ